MAKSDPRLQLETLFVLDARQRMICTREPQPSSGPAFIFIRGESACAWAVRANVAERVALEVNRLASQETPSANWDRPLLHAERYALLLAGRIRSGPAFAFPEHLQDDGQAIVIDDAIELSHHFSGWVAGEIENGRAPILAMVQNGHPVSICFCARRAAEAAEAGVETAAAFRGQGYAPRAAIAWAKRVRAQGLTPVQHRLVQPRVTGRRPQAQARPLRSGLQRRRMTI